MHLLSLKPYVFMAQRNSTNVVHKQIQPFVAVRPGAYHEQWTRVNRGHRDECTETFVTNDICWTREP